MDASASVGKRLERRASARGVVIASYVSSVMRRESADTRERRDPLAQGSGVQRELLRQLCDA